MFKRKTRARFDSLVWVCGCGNFEFAAKPISPTRCPQCRRWQILAPKVDAAKGEYETRGDAA